MPVARTDWVGGVALFTGPFPRAYRPACCVLPYLHSPPSKFGCFWSRTCLGSLTFHPRFDLELEFNCEGSAPLLPGKPRSHRIAAPSLPLPPSASRPVLARLYIARQQQLSIRIVVSAAATPQSWPASTQTTTRPCPGATGTMTLLTSVSCNPMPPMVQSLS